MSVISVAASEKVPSSQGFACEFRFYITARDGKRKLKVQSFDPAKYPTERDVLKAVEGQFSALKAGTLGGKIVATFGTIIDRYRVEELPSPQHSTQTVNKGLIDLHIRPKWQDVKLADVTAIAVKQWMEKLPFGAASRLRSRYASMRPIHGSVKGSADGAMGSKQCGGLVLGGRRVIADGDAG